MLYGQEAPFTPTRLQFNNAKQPFNLNQVVTTTNKYSKKKIIILPFWSTNYVGIGTDRTILLSTLTKFMSVQAHISI